MSTKIVAFRQSGVLPFRITSDGIDILLITTRGGDQWTIPKGHVKPGLSASRSAVEEAREEAGIKGRVLKPRLGFFEYQKFSSQYRVMVFLYEVTSVKKSWEEDAFRTRKWVPIRKARKMVKFKGMRRIFEKAEQRLGGSV
jgi:8-oxo-dGTP pyrophosphatase MutT (NUDIX family)